MDIKTLSDKELMFGYKDIILYYENDVNRDKAGFNKRKLKVFLESTPIELVSKKTPSGDFQNKKVSFLYYTTPKGTSEIVSILKHLRNCYAHGNVEKKHIRGKQYLCFQDFKKSNGTEQISMIGQIARNKFEAFVKELKNTKQ